MDYSLVEILAAFNHNGDLEAAQAEIDEVMAEEYTPPTEEERAEVNLIFEEMAGGLW